MVLFHSTPLRKHLSTIAGSWPLCAPNSTLRTRTICLSQGVQATLSLGAPHADGSDTISGPSLEPVSRYGGLGRQES